MAPSKFQLLYVSQLAAGCDFGVVRSIVTVSRQRNRERNITGTLLFDGERFGQLIESAESDVLELGSHRTRLPAHEHSAAARRPLRCGAVDATLGQRVLRCA